MDNKEIIAKCITQQLDLTWSWHNNNSFSFAWEELKKGVVYVGQIEQRQLGSWD